MARPKAAGEYAIGALPVVGNAMDVIATVRKSSKLAAWACTTTKVGHFGVMAYAGVTAWQTNDFLSMALMLVSGLRGFRAACFTEGTQVVVGFDEHGQAITRNIEDLRKGDLVVSRDQNDPNAELVLREVQQVFVRRVYELQVISIEDNETGETQQINATDEHPFWVDGKGWTAASELVAGDRVQNPDGAWATVTSNLVQVHAAGITVYNLEVASGHTYFVADGVSAEPFVWVHNATYKKRHADAKGASIEADAQIHHSYPQKYRTTADAHGYDIDDPVRTYAVKATPGPYTNVHSMITKEWRRWDARFRERFGRAPNHKEVLQKQMQMDKKWRRFYDRHIK